MQGKLTIQMMIKKNRNEIIHLNGGYDCKPESNAGIFAGLAGGGALFGGPVGFVLGVLAAGAYLSYHNCPQY